MQTPRKWLWDWRVNRTRVTPYVSLALEQEIAGGYPDGTFKPDNPITRAESAKIIWKTMLVNPGINGYVLPAN